MLETIRGGKYTIKRILKDNWADFAVKNQGNIRDAVTENVNKVMACGNKDILGESVFSCSTCGLKRRIAHTCKSRFCNSCGKVMTDKWMERAQRELLNVPYYHVVFSPPSELWLLFAANRKALNCLFHSTAGAILSWCREEGFEPGIVAVLHTFAANLSFHAHIHILLTLGGGSKGAEGLWRKNEFFPHQWLKTEFKRRLLKDLRGLAKAKELIVPHSVKLGWWKKLKTANFYEVSQKLWAIIWYVHIGEKLDNADFTVRYIGRYAKRPCLSETNIVGYDREKGTATFRYKDRLEKIEKQLTLPVMEFIGRLARHIPDKGFHVIRYYGLYAKCVKNKIPPLLLAHVANLYSIIRLRFEPDKRGRNWRERKLLSTGVDPLLCPRCRVPMLLSAIVCQTRAGPLRTIILR